MPLSSTNALPFAVSAVQSACADTDDEASTNVRAAIAEHVLDIAAALLMVIFWDACGSSKTMPSRRDYFRSTFVKSEVPSAGRASNIGRAKSVPSSDPSATTVSSVERQVAATDLPAAPWLAGAKCVLVAPAVIYFSILSWTCQKRCVRRAVSSDSLP